jgi:hypothetical protein
MEIMITPSVLVFFIQNGHAFAKVDEKPILVGYWGRKGAYDWGFPGL